MWNKTKYHLDSVIRHMCYGNENSFHIISKWLIIHEKNVELIYFTTTWHLNFVLTHYSKLGAQGILVLGCLSVCPCIRSKHECHILWTVHARILKFYIWIPLGEIADRHFFLDRVISLSGVMPLWKNQYENWYMPYLVNCAC